MTVTTCIIYIINPSKNYGIICFDIVKAWDDYLGWHYKEKLAPSPNKSMDELPQRWLLYFSLWILIKILCFIILKVYITFQTLLIYDSHDFKNLRILRSITINEAWEERKKNELIIINPYITPQAQDTWRRVIIGCKRKIKRTNGAICFIRSDKVYYFYFAPPISKNLNHC